MTINYCINSLNRILSYNLLNSKEVKKLLLLLLTIFSVFFGQSQEDNLKNVERIQALKIAFITQKLNLSPEEAQTFWPVYNRYEADLKRVNSQNAGGDVIDNEEKVLNLRKSYRAQFVKVLGQPKMNKLFTAERDFRGALIRKLRNQQGQRRKL